MRFFIDNCRKIRNFFVMLNITTIVCHCLNKTFELVATEATINESDQLTLPITAKDGGLSNRNRVTDEES